MEYSPPSFQIDFYKNHQLFDVDRYNKNEFEEKINNIFFTSPSVLGEFEPFFDKFTHKNYEFNKIYICLNDLDVVLVLKKNNFHQFNYKYDDYYHDIHIKIVNPECKCFKNIFKTFLRDYNNFIKDYYNFLPNDKAEADEFESEEEN